MKPQPIWQKWMKDPNKRENVFKFYFFIMVLVNVFIVIGFILFVIFFFRR